MHDERIQKSFTSKLEGMEDKNYHERLKELKMYSLERRRERYLIIHAWEMIEEKRKYPEFTNRKNRKMQENCLQINTIYKKWCQNIKFNKNKVAQ